MSNFISNTKIICQKCSFTLPINDYVSSPNSTYVGSCFSCGCREIKVIKTLEPKVQLTEDYENEPNPN